MISELVYGIGLLKTKQKKFLQTGVCQPPGQSHTRSSQTFRWVNEDMEHRQYCRHLMSSRHLKGHSGPRMSEVFPSERSGPRVSHVFPSEYQAGAKIIWENSSLWFCPCPCPVFCPLFLPCYFCPCPVFCPLTWVHINSQRLQHWHVWKAVPSVEQLPGKHQKGVGSFREDNDFADMTLACEDGQQVEAHKVILAASSLFPRSCLEGTSTLTH